MEKQLVLYAGPYRYQYQIATQAPLVVAQSGLADLILPGLPVERLSFRVDGSSGSVLASVDDGPEEALDSNPATLAGFRIYVNEVAKPQCFDLMALSQVSLGASPSNTIVLEGLRRDPALVLVKEGEDWQLVSSNVTVTINNRQVSLLPQTLQFGDELAFGGVMVKHMGDEVWVSGAQASSQQLVASSSSRYDFYEDYPDYHRSPRLIYREPEDKVTIKGPTDMPRKPANQLLRAIVPPLVMVSMVVLLSFFQPRGIYMYIMVVTSIVTVIFSITNFFKTRKEYKENVIEREVLFREYLLDKSQELYQIQEDQRQGQLYHYPKVEELLAMAERYDHRIYEKTPLHFDFLSYRLGLGEREASFSLTYPPLEREKKLDDLEKEGLALYDQYRQTRELPIVANLMSGPVGYIGPRSVVLEQLQLLVYQLAFFHSYHDVQVITLVPEEEKDDWTWMRWLPHATLQDINVRGLVYDQRSRDQVLNSLYQVLKIRKSQRANKEVRESTLFTPHYVVVVTDASFILDHVIMEFFNEDPTDLGCSIIFVQDTLSSLSENIVTIVDMKDRHNGILVLEKGELVNKRFRLDHLAESFDKEALPRLLAPLRHLQNLKNSIPETVGFLEMYGTKAIEELNIPQLWASHAPHQSLAVPLGMRGKDDLVYLDLHEKAHGPHGLIAGTTGAGKSELIQSYILSLALNFHPHDVGFLLIDYKGGGMANLFKDLPHLLGTITNLDAAASMRALVSIQAENTRRQALFSKYEVNHINQYQKLYKTGEVAEPLPHLFLIADEFAELKTNEPEFMKQLVSTSRIGRSLGVHLILATQKPTGVVDDQIWSNSRFKLALKVATTQDSQELLKTADAADITQTGRAYLQVGNNEIYELFQSAYSGGDYQPDKDRLNIEDHTIYAINANGQYDILTKDLSGLDAAETVAEIPSELETVVKAIKATTDQLQVAPLPKPWLPPLAERIPLHQLTTLDYQKEWTTGVHDLVVTLGMADMPSRQAQETARINLTTDGHLLLFGGPGTGKTTFLQTTAINLARSHSPNLVNFFLLDFGTNGLAPLENLPHVADLVRIDQEKKLAKFLRIMNDELDRRKKLLARSGVASLVMYHEVTGHVEPELVLFLDGFEAMKGEPFEGELFKLLTRVGREGTSVGVHLVITAGQQGNIRALLHSNIRHQLTLRQNDKSEVYTIVGRTDFSELPDIPGRGLIKRDEVDIIQLALPNTGAQVNEISSLLRDEALEMDEYWTGQRPLGVPMVPETLYPVDFYQMPTVQNSLLQGHIPLGLSLETVEACVWKPQQGNLLYLYEDDNRLKQQIDVNRYFANELKVPVILLAPKMSLIDYQEDVPVISEPKKVAEMIDAIYLKLEERIASKETALSRVFIWQEFDDILSILDGVHLTRLGKIFDMGPKVGYSHFISVKPGFNKNIDEASKAVKATQQALVARRLNGQYVVEPPNKPAREPLLEDQENYLVVGGVITKIQVPII